MILVLIGPPGGGKGTHCKILADKYGLKHLSSGDIFRAEMANSTELGKKAKSFIDAGKLVPDDVVIAMMTEAVLKAEDCILDGFPRTVNQAKALDEALNQQGSEISGVIELAVDDDVVAERLTQRRVCLACGATFHLKNLKPKIDGICDTCGDNLVQRDDDKKDVILDRLSTYHNQTEPILDYYAGSGKEPIKIVAVGAIDEITELLVSAIDSI